MSKKIKLFFLGLDLVFLVCCLIVYLDSVFGAVQVWHDNWKVEQDKIQKYKRYEFDQVDYAGKGRAYEYRDGKFVCMDVNLKQ